MARISATTVRKPLSPSQKLKLFEDQGHICPLCEQEMVEGQKLIDEHMRSLGLCGTNDLSNRAIVHQHCAETKTRGPGGDAKRITDAKRQKRKAFGFEASRNPLPFGKNSPLKRKIGGGVVKRYAD